MFKSIKGQIGLLTAIPLLGACLLGMLSIYEISVERQRHQVMVPLTQIALKAAEFAHEMQKERGKSVGLVSSDYATKNAGIVAEQRRASDGAIKAFVAEMQAFDKNLPSLKSDFAELTEDVTHLEALRADVDARKFAVPKVIAEYTHIVEDTIKLIGHITETSPSESITAELFAFLMLVEAKESGGLERAIGAAVLNETAGGAFNFERYQAYLAKLGSETAFLSGMKIIATKDQLAVLDNTMTGPVIKRVEDMRKVIAQIPMTKDTKGLTGNEWFATATERLNLLKQATDQFGIRALHAVDVDVTAYTRQMYLIIGFVLIVLVVSAAFALHKTTSITRALVAVARTVNRLARGETVDEIPVTGRTDEIGDIARASEIFRDALVEKERLSAIQEREDAERRTRQERVDTIVSRFKSQSHEIQDAVRENMQRMQGTAESLIRIADNTANQAGGASHASEEASSNVQTVAAASEEMAASIGEISRQVGETTRVVAAATTITRETNDKIAGLASAAEKIGDVVNLIQDIAEQTNLLALNATIEAARAGDMGKGFAVVAAEVKELANQTSKATGEIASQISSIQAATEESVEAIRRISDQIEEVNTYTSGISTAVEQQGGATSEITRNVQEAARGTQAVAENVSAVTVAAGETNSAAGEANDAASNVMEHTERLNGLVDDFLRDVAAA